MKRAITVILAFAFVAAIAFIAGRTSMAPRVPGLRVDLAPGLTDSVRDVELQGVPLAEAVEYLSRTFGTPLAADRQALEDIAIVDKSRIFFVGKGVTLEAVIMGLAVNGGDRSGWTAPSYKLVDGEIVLTSDSDAETHGVLRCYNVEPIVILEKAMRPIEVGTESPGGGLFGSGRSTAATWIREEVIANVEPDAWHGHVFFSDEREFGHIWETEHALWVRHTPQVHAKVVRYLNELYEMQLQRQRDRKHLIHRLQAAEGERGR